MKYKDSGIYKGFGIRKKSWLGKHLQVIEKHMGLPTDSVRIEVMIRRDADDNYAAVQFEYYKLLKDGSYKLFKTALKNNLELITSFVMFLDDADTCELQHDAVVELEDTGMYQRVRTIDPHLLCEIKQGKKFWEAMFGTEVVE